MSLQVYNTLTRKKEELIPQEKEFRIYSCGPTVYNYAHIGNLRTYVFVDNLRRVLQYEGYSLKHVMNITDVGHLESDADEGEDKMVKAARRENKDPFAIAQFYTECFLEDMCKLHIDMPDTIAKATEHIPEMITYVQDILKNGYAYETSKGIYFDITKLDHYPVLSNRKLEEQLAGARVEVDEEKRNPYDFAIWIKAPENHIMKWESPWGLSYPGWHLECSAMGRKYLGEIFDIHTGGVDHIPTHHENEIAQAKGATGHIPARVWMHTEFLLVDGGKMSKSLNNAYTLAQLEENGIEPLAFKLFCYSAHYRTKLNFTFEGAKAAQTALQRLRDAYTKHVEGTGEVEKTEIETYRQQFRQAITDDLNMPLAMSYVWEVAKKAEKAKAYSTLLEEWDTVLGLDLKNVANYKQEVMIPEDVQSLLEQRKQAREEKNWTLSDSLRDEIQAKGYMVKDTKEGMQLEKI